MNVRPLFHYDENIKPEDLVHFLDLPDSDPKKQAFLDACDQHAKLSRAWSRTKRLAKAGSSLPQYEPKKDIRNIILLQAQAYAQSEEFQATSGNNDNKNNNKVEQEHPQKTTVLHQTKKVFTGHWKYAWQFAAAATFLVVSLAVYFQNQTTSTSTVLTYELVAQVETLDEELYQLEEDLELLSMSMGLYPGPMPGNGADQRAG